MVNMNMIQAINLAFVQEMKKNPNIIIMGEDVGKNGGVFRVTDGLYKKFGDERVIDTPLAESGIVGTAIGMAVYGLKPVVEMQFDGFSYPAFDQIISHVSRIRTRSRGRFSSPVVIRFPYSGGIHALEHHSESPETFFCHIPGLKVVVPSTPKNAKGLLTSVLRCNDPVVFMEPKKVYRSIVEDVSEKEFVIPLGQAEIVKQGTDLTLICWGAMRKTCLEAVAKSKYNIEIIDLLTLSPLDRKTIIESVKKTGRAVIVYEAPRTCGFGAEIAAILADKNILDLKAPVIRVTGFDTVMPLYKLENYYIPGVTRILKGIEKVMAY